MASSIPGSVRQPSSGRTLGGLFPYVLYQYVKQSTAASDVAALAISPFVFYGITIAVIAFTFAHSNRARRLSEARRRKQRAAARVPEAPGNGPGA